MELKLFEKISPITWQIKPFGNMRVPGVIYANQKLLEQMDHKVYEQLCNVATLPGIVGAAYAMPDAHWGYGFPIGGVAAFDAELGGVISAGGVGFDISCGVRLLHTGMNISEIEEKKKELADLLFKRIPAGMGSQSATSFSPQEMDKMLRGGASWAVSRGFGESVDLDFIEEHGQMQGAEPTSISTKAKERQKREMGTLGSGNHYLEIQEVNKLFHPKAAAVMGLNINDAVISIHCGSRGLGHQIGTDYLRLMLEAAKKYNINIPDRELACAPIHSEVGQQYLGAMRGAINCALANRQMLTHFTRMAFREIYPHGNLRLVYDVSHNTCKREQHLIGGEKRELYVHRKGATRAFGPNHPALPAIYKEIGQPVLIGGSMGVGSYVLVGTPESEILSFSSACHGAGRAMSRTEASRHWFGPKVIQELKDQGILIRSDSSRGIAEEAPEAYKNLHQVVDAAEEARLSQRVAYLKPHICIKG